jgi:hypothetical protein
VGAANISSLMGPSHKRFTPKFSSLQEVLMDALSRQRPAQSYQQSDEPDDDVVATTRGSDLETKLREVIGDAVFEDLEQHGRTSLALSNWLNSHGTKHLAAAKTLAWAIVQELDSEDVLDRLTREIEQIG